MTKSLPLPPRYFNCPELTKREQQYLITKAKESAKALIDATRNNDGPVRWTEAGIHRGVQMYKGEARNLDSVIGEPVTYGCGATSIKATLEEVVDFFDLSTHEKMKSFVMFNDDMMDGQLLYTLYDPALVHTKMHQITVKWTVIEMPSALIKNRDFLTLECQNAFTDSSGRRGWVRSYHSIKLPCCPDLQSEYNLVRGSFYHTGHVFIESERPGYLDVIFSAQVNLKGNLRLPAKLQFIATKKRLSAVADLAKILPQRRLGAQRFLGDLELVPKNQRTRCLVCNVKFGLMTRKSRCRRCGEVVCSSCSTIWDIHVPKFGHKKVRVCVKCAKNKNSGTNDAMELPTPSMHSASHASSSGEEYTYGADVNKPTEEHIYSASTPNAATSTPNSARLRPPPSPQVDDGYPPFSARTKGGHNGYRSQPPPPPPSHRSYKSTGSDVYDSHGSNGSFGPEYDYGRNNRPAPSPGGYNRGGNEFRTPPQYGDDYGYNPALRRQNSGSDRYGPPRYMDNNQYSTPYSNNPVRGAPAMRPANKDKLMGMNRPTHLTDETASLSSELTGSYVDEPVTLTSKVLEEHTRRGGSSGNRPYPSHQQSRPYQSPQQNDYYSGSYSRPQQQNNTRGRNDDHYDSEYYEPPPPPPPAYSKTAERYLRNIRGSDNNRGNYTYASSHSSRGNPLEYETRSIGGRSARDETRSNNSQDLNSYHSGTKLDTRSLGGRSVSNNSYQSNTSRFQTAGPSPATNSDYDQYEAEPPRFEELDPSGSPKMPDFADSFSTLLRKEDLHRHRADSTSSSLMDIGDVSFCDSIDDFDTFDDDIDRDSARIKDVIEELDEGPIENDSNAMSVNKTSIVQVYQKILELTKEQHKLDSQPNADTNEKNKVARELLQLYQKLNQLTLDPEDDVQ